MKKKSMEYIRRHILIFYNYLILINQNEVCSSNARLTECYEIYPHRSLYPGIREENQGQTSNAEEAITEL